jgi:hypothetical protein
MPEINATAQDPAANSYLTLEEADQGMDSFLHAQEWQELEEATRERLLIRGSALIDQYQAWPPKFDVDQSMAFPTSIETDGVLPAEAKKALLEYCDMMAAGDIDHLKRLQAEGVTNASMLGQNATMDKDLSGLPAGARKELEKLWTKYNAPRVMKTPHHRDGCDDFKVFG